MKTLLLATLALSYVFMVGCTSPDALKKAVEENPDILFNAIEKHPEKFIEVVNKAAREAQKNARANEEQKEKDRMEKEFSNPKTPALGKNRVYFGNPSAPITIVEYSDFECPFCSRGFNTINQVLNEYGDKVRVLFKHLPLDFHPNAMPAAKYYEAIAIQSHKKAHEFHDLIFKNQSGLKSGGDKFLKKMAKKAGANMTKLAKDFKSDAVKKIVEADIAEAKKYGFSGTPGFMINGVSLKGAYPFPEFKKIIDRHLEKKK